MKMEICRIYDQVDQHIVICCLHHGIIISLQEVDQLRQEHIFGCSLHKKYGIWSFIVCCSLQKIEVTPHVGWSLEKIRCNKQQELAIGCGVNMCCSHIQFVGHYLLSFSCNVSVNESNENNFNVHEYTKTIHPYQLVSECRSQVRYTLRLGGDIVGHWIKSVLHGLTTSYRSLSMVM